MNPLNIVCGPQGVQGHKLKTTALASVSCSEMLLELNIVQKAVLGSGTFQMNGVLQVQILELLVSMGTCQNPADMSSFLKDLSLYIATVPFPFPDNYQRMDQVWLLLSSPNYIIYGYVL